MYFSNFSENYFDFFGTGFQHFRTKLYSRTIKFRRAFAFRIFQKIDVFFAKIRQKNAIFYVQNNILYRSFLHYKVAFVSVKKNSAVQIHYFFRRDRKKH